MTVVLISLGNSLRRDDGVAAELCAALPAELQQKLTYYDLGIHGEQLPAYIKDADAAIVVDAIAASADTLGCLEVFPYVPKYETSVRSTHGISWFHELQFADSAPPITFVGVKVTDDGWGEGLSDGIKRQKRQLIDELAAVCRQVLQEVG